MRLLISLIFPWLTFFTIGRPISGIICFFLQISLIGWFPATIWAIFALGQYKTDKKIESALNKQREHSVGYVSQDGQSSFNTSTLSRTNDRVVPEGSLPSESFINKPVRVANCCPSCRSSIAPGWSFCEECGTRLTS